jgi:hypothetical protein
MTHRSVIGDLSLVIGDQICLRIVRSLNSAAGTRGKSPRLPVLKFTIRDVRGLVPTGSPLIFG